MREDGIDHENLVDAVNATSTEDDYDEIAIPQWGDGDDIKGFVEMEEVKESLFADNENGNGRWKWWEWNECGPS